MRTSVNATDAWQTLTSSLSAASGTNITIFVHSNIVQNPSCGCDGDSFADMDSGENALAIEMAEPIAPMPMAIPINGSGDGVPVMLYPPGFDLSGFVIFDPVTGESVSGAGYSTRTFSLDSPLLDDPQPLDGGGGNGPATETGYYQVVRGGTQLIGITNGTTLSGVVTIPLEVGNDSGILANLSLTEDNVPVGNVSIEAVPFPLPLHLVADTTQMSNGVHHISASARWEYPGNETNEDGGSFEADSPPVAVNIYNEFSFPNWMPRFGELGDSLLVEAQSAHTNATWYVDVYGQDGYYIGTMEGQTTDGTIEAAWNLIGPYDEYHGDNVFYFIITTVFNGNQNNLSASSPVLKTYRDTDPWPNTGRWVMVAQHAFEFYPDPETLYAELDGFVRIGQGIGISPNPDSDGHAFALHFGTADPQGDSDWAQFRQALYNPLSRNLVYFGHGGPNGIGYNPANTNRYISAAEIANTLHTIPDGQTNRHAFRMVILDGCSTAKGNLPEAFGIIHKEDVPGTYYDAAALRPSAFVGWTANKYIAFLNVSYFYDHIHFIQHIEYFLEQGDGIKTAVNLAGQQPDVDWLWTSQFKVFGYGDLSFWAFNR